MQTAERVKPLEKEMRRLSKRISGFLGDEARLGRDDAVDAILMSLETVVASASASTRESLVVKVLQHAENGR